MEVENLTKGKRMKKNQQYEGNKKTTERNLTGLKRTIKTRLKILCLFY